MDKIFRYYSDPQVKNRVTVVGKKIEDTLIFAVSRCSKKDNFNRKIGRSIAEGRLNAGKIHSWVKWEDNITTEVFVKYAKKISDLVNETKVVC